MTKPSRLRSQGREARCGSSLRVERARMAAKPPTASGVTTASVPPANMTSASSRWMTLKASPMAWAPVAHAVAGAEFGPLQLKRMETCPAARLMISPGMKNGETRLGPRSSIFVCISSMSGRPPMPEPMITPRRSWSQVFGSSLASSTAIWAAATA